MLPEKCDRERCPGKCQPLRSHGTLSRANRYTYTHRPRQTGRPGTIRTPQRAAALALITLTVFPLVAKAQPQREAVRAPAERTAAAPRLFAEPGPFEVDTPARPSGAHPTPPHTSLF